MQSHEASPALTPVRNVLPSARRWYRPQFRLRTILIIMLWAAIVLAINLRPPKVQKFAHRPEIKDRSNSRFHVEQGWPFMHLDYTAYGHMPLEYTALNHAGWPLSLPAPPKATNWYALTANILVLSLTAAVFLWMAKWVWDIVNELRRWSIKPGTAESAHALATSILLCFLGWIMIAWGTTQLVQVSYPDARSILSPAWHSNIDWKFVNLNNLIVPLLFVAGGLFSLGAARRWLREDEKKSQITWIAFVSTALIVLYDGMLFRLLVWVIYQTTYA